MASHLSVLHRPLTVPFSALSPPKRSAAGLTNKQKLEKLCGVVCSEFEFEDAVETVFTVSETKL
eukprot:784418-Rhodomonas_salina.3